jgi:pSer/pThr/pTyr-binding forkhead associated (FHA) protein
MKAGGKFYYTDTGSTNGSFVEGQDLGTNVALELKNGMEITFGGASLARITIVEA